MATVDYTFTCANPACGVTITKPWRQTSEPQPQYCGLPCWYAVRSQLPYTWRKYTFTEAQNQQIREACRTFGQLKALWKTGVFGETPYPILKRQARQLGIARTQPDDVWTEAEDRLLGEWIGTTQALDTLAVRFRRAGYHRSPSAIRERLWKLGYDVKQGEWTARDIAQGLEIDEHSVTRWIAKGWLKARRTSDLSKARHYVSSADLKRFLVQYPFVAAHGDMRLVWVVTILAGSATLDRAAVGD